jgi:hypothetical protein
VPVDASAVKTEALRALRWGQPVTASGLFDRTRTRFTASGIEAAE